MAGPYWTTEEINLLQEKFASETKIGLERLLKRSWRAIDFKAKELGLTRLSQIWTQEEVDLLVQNFEGCSWVKLNGLIPRKSERGIQTKAQRLGLLRDITIVDKLSKEKIAEIISDYKSGLSIKKLCIKHRIGSGPCTDVLKKNGVERRNYKQRARIYTLDEDFFEIIDSEEKAYILGMIFADGNVEVFPKAMVRIGLKVEDTEHLLKMNVAIGSNSPLFWKKNGVAKNGRQKWLVTTHWRSQKLSSDLTKFGCISPKWDSIRLPTNIPNHLLRDFLRGYIDGDGSLIILNNKYKSPRLAIYGNRLFLKDVQRIFSEQLSITSCFTEKESSAMLTVYRVDEVKTILDWLYEGSTLYLTRKYNKYSEIKERKRT